MNMFIRLVKIDKKWGSHNEYYLSEVIINTTQIVYMAENTDLKTALTEGKMNLNLNKVTGFTNLKLNSRNDTAVITVVGDPSTIEGKIAAKPIKKLLRD
tara:strand:+ start:184 stop:480 length:297 start_codon:yes stop_codon:yes gene_type:complete